MGEIAADTLTNALTQPLIGNFILEKAGALSNLMSGSSGRDKMCALLQYSVDLYAVSMRHSDEY